LKVAPSSAIWPEQVDLAHQAGQPLQRLELRPQQDEVHGQDHREHEHRHGRVGRRPRHLQVTRGGGQHDGGADDHQGVRDEDAPEERHATSVPIALRATPL
jgi:hypothetical protein